MFGQSTTSLPRTRLAYRNALEDLTPESFFALQRGLREEATLSLRAVLCLLRLSSFDPDLLLRCRQRLLALCDGDALPGPLRKDLHTDLVRVRDHVLFMDSERDVCFELARIHMGLNEYAVALELFQDSNNYVSEHHVTWHNMGVCCFYLQQYEKAIYCFQKVGEEET